MGWIFVATTVVCTAYGQLVLKWQVNRAGAFPHSTTDRIQFVTGLLTNPWVLSSLVAAGVAAVAWAGALTRFDLSRAYPFVGLTFVTTLIGSAVLFNESITSPKVIGTLLVLCGVIIASQG